MKMLDTNNDLHNTSKQPVWEVKADITVKNRENRKFHSEDKIRHAAMFEDSVRRVFQDSRVWTNYRKNFISIKVEHPSVSACKTPDGRALDRFVDDAGISVIAKGASIIFHF